MKKYYYRTIELANYIIKNNSTIRQTAKVYNMAKSTVHYDLSFRLPYMDTELYNKVKKILKIHFNEKHLKGGEATKQKYLNKKR